MKPMDSKPLKEAARSDEDVLRLARERGVTAASAWSDNFKAAEDDVDFVEGKNQWPEAVRQYRENAGQTCLTLNNVPTFIERVTGEQRQNQPGIHVHAADDFGANYDFIDGKGKRKVRGANVLEGIVRAIQFNSNAEDHYDRAHQHAVESGLGWLRVFTRYANAKDFDQELVISSVKNRWSVLMDPDAEQPDMSDAKYGFVGTSILRSEFDARYPMARVGGIDGLPEDQRNFWATEERITVAEYFTREAKERELLLFSNGQTEYHDVVKDVLDGDMLMGSDGVTIVRRRKVVTWQVVWRKITAWSVLEGPLVTPFTTIPIVPVAGRARDMRDGSTVYSSLIRHAKDAKRMDNYWMSAATDRVALAPKAQWVGEIQAVEGFRDIWNQANTLNSDFLPYNEGYTRPERVSPPSMPVAEIGLAAQMNDRVKSTIGIYDASIGAQSNETSGRAINARDRQASTSSYAFSDNLNRAIRRVGLLLVEAIPKIYDTERVMRLRNEDGTGDWITINQVVKNPETGEDVVINGIGSGEYDVSVSAGPSFATQREEAAMSQMELLRISPDLAPVISDVMIENMDWPQADKIANRIRRSMDPKLLSSGEIEEMQDGAGPEEGPKEPSPEEQLAAKQMQLEEAKIAVEMKQAEADMAKAEADIATAQADMAEARARMAQPAIGMPQ